MSLLTENALITYGYICFLLEPLLTAWLCQFEDIIEKTKAKMSKAQTASLDTVPMSSDNEQHEANIHNYIDRRRFERVQRVESREHIIRRAQLQQIKQIIEAKWTWACVRIVGDDPIDRILCDDKHELIIVADWDLPKLAPKIEMFKDGARVYSAKPTSDTSEDFYTARSGNKTMLLNAELRDRTGSSFETQALVAWRGYEEDDRNKSRASLLFHYSQIYPHFLDVCLALIDIVRLAHDAPIEDEHQEPRGKSLPARFALCLLTAAYFEQPIAGSPKSVTERLTDLLNLYASLLDSRLAETCVCVRPSLKDIGQFEIVTDEPNSEAQLIVLDPIREVEAERNWRGKLVATSETPKTLEGLQNILNEQTLVGTLENLTPARKADFYKRCESGMQSKLARMDSRRRASATPSRRKLFDRSRILYNLTCLCLFLVFRTTMLGSLMSWREDLKDQARDDMINFKRSVFANSPRNELRPEFEQDMFLSQTEETQNVEDEIYDDRAGSLNDSSMGTQDSSAEKPENLMQQQAREGQQLLDELMSEVLRGVLAGQQGDPQANLEQLLALLGDDLDLGGIDVDSSSSSSEDDLDEDERELERIEALLKRMTDAGASKFPGNEHNTDEFARDEL